MLTAVKSTEREVQKRILWADILRILAMLGVVILHAAAPVMYSFGKIGTSRWMVANLYDSLTRASVPLFVMLSGMMLLDTAKEDSIHVFFTKRFRKVLIPFLFWGIVYLGWKSVTTHTGLNPGTVIKEFIAGPIYYHFWFIYMILGLYLVTPILKQYVKQAGLKNLLYFLCLWFVFSSLFPLFHRASHIAIGLQLPMLTGYAGYFVLGYALKQIKPSKKLLWAAVLCLVVGLTVTFAGTGYFSLKKGAFEEYFYDYMSPNVVLMALGLFILFMNINPGSVLYKKPSMEKLISAFSEASFGVYLVHVLILELLEKGVLGIKISGLAFNPLFSIPMTSAATVLIAFVLVTLLRKNPLFKHIV